MRAEIVEGLRWLWHKPLIRYMAFLTGGLNLVNAAVPLVVIVLAKQMGASDVEIGLIFSIGGIGGIVGSLIGGQIQKRFSFGQVIIVCDLDRGSVVSTLRRGPAILSARGDLRFDLHDGADL